LDLYACAECGRCQDVCPAWAERQSLNPENCINPKLLIMSLRKTLTRALKDAELKGNAHVGNALDGNALKSGDKWAAATPYEEAQARSVWRCMGCLACTVACPTGVQHLPKFTAMRRSLIDEGTLPSGLSKTLSSYKKRGNSFGKPAKDRVGWSKNLGFDLRFEPTAASPLDPQKSYAEYLWLVGDFASYHPRAIEVTRRVASLLKSAGASFGILGPLENCSGNDLRRIGDEWLFRELAQKNIDLINSCNFGKIFTTDPHTYNTVKNEYPNFGLEAEIVHHSQTLLEFIKTGRLSLPERAAEALLATYHDPCLLGRHNGVYEAPREIIRRLGFKLVEMPRSRQNSFCCGAGGGRIFMAEDDGIARRAGEIRVKEASKLEGVSVLATSCPKDLVTLSEAVKNLGLEGRLSVKDIAELF
jgi:Fe-S oxidoreductase